MASAYDDTKIIENGHTIKNSISFRHSTSGQYLAIKHMFNGNKIVRIRMLDLFNGREMFISKEFGREVGIHQVTDLGICIVSYTTNKHQLTYFQLLNDELIPFHEDVSTKSFQSIIFNQDFTKYIKYAPSTHYSVTELTGDFPVVAIKQTAVKNLAEKVLPYSAQFLNIMYFGDNIVVYTLGTYSAQYKDCMQSYECYVVELIDSDRFEQYVISSSMHLPSVLTTYSDMNIWEISHIFISDHNPHIPECKCPAKVHCESQTLKFNSSDKSITVVPDHTAIDYEKYEVIIDDEKPPEVYSNVLFKIGTNLGLVTMTSFELTVYYFRKSYKKVKAASSKFS